jgi:hypothetical protein
MNTEMLHAFKESLHGTFHPRGPYFLRSLENFKTQQKRKKAHKHLNQRVQEAHRKNKWTPLRQGHSVEKVLSHRLISRVTTESCLHAEATALTCKVRRIPACIPVGGWFVILLAQ